MDLLFFPRRDMIYAMCCLREHTRQNRWVMVLTPSSWRKLLFIRISVSIDQWPWSFRRRKPCQKVGERHDVSTIHRLPAFPILWYPVTASFFFFCFSFFFLASLGYHISFLPTRIIFCSKKKKKDWLCTFDELLRFFPIIYFPPWLKQSSTAMSLNLISRLMHCIPYPSTLLDNTGL